MIHTLKLYMGEILTFGRSHKRTSIVVGVIFLALFALIAFRIATNSKVEEARAVSPATVALISVLESSQATTPLSLTGVVRSESEALLRAEVSRQVSKVYQKVGVNLAAGTLIAEFENAAERASVLQAQGVLDQAEAQFEKVSSGQRSEEREVLRLTLQSAEDALETSRVSLVNTLIDAYTDVNSAIILDADSLFIDPTGVVPQLDFLTSDNQVASKLKNTRPSLSEIISRQKAMQSSLAATADLEAESAKAEAEVREVKDFLDLLISALNSAVATSDFSASDISSALSTTKTARASLIADLSAITSARDTLFAKKVALSIAQQNLEKGESGERSEDVAAAGAALKQAQGSYAAALASLEKTRIRTPISGTLNSLSISAGEFASALELVAVVSNNNALQIETFVTSDERNEIAIGDDARIANKYAGVVTSIAPGIDPETKKVQIRIGLIEDAPLTHSESVHVSILRKGTSVSDEIRIPISALKIRADGMFIFTLEDELLVAHKVTIGKIVGDKVVVLDGIAEDATIVADARGLSEGGRAISE